MRGGTTNRRAALGLLLGAAKALRGGQPRLQRGNLYTVPIEEGFAELEWLSSSSFRVGRQWKGSAAPRPAFREEKVPVTVRATGDSLEFTTRYLRVELEKSTMRLRVHDSTGSLLLADVRGPRRINKEVVWERRRNTGERFWGLGPMAELDGQEKESARIETQVPLLISSEGYGEYFRPTGNYSYEFGKTRRIEGPAAELNEYFFYYGPTAKEILEEHAAVGSPLRRVEWGMFRLADRPPNGAWSLPTAEPSWRGLADVVRWVLRCGYSGILLPAVDVNSWREADEEVQERARQMFSYLAVIYGAGAGSKEEKRLAEERERWVPFLVSYGYEAQERGFPLVRPLEMQYPKDPQASLHHEQFMLGDELLVAPVLRAGTRRSVYLPPGQWTEWNTNVRFGGRQVVEARIAPDRIPLFVKNGSLVPVAEGRAGRRIAAHYFPRLAGEFFFYEEGSGALTQLHAAPAGELLRLEIEPAEERVWEWVVHHVRRPSRIQAGGDDFRQASVRTALQPGQWWYDEDQGNLHLQVQPAAGTVHVVYVGF